MRQHTSFRSGAGLWWLLAGLGATTVLIATAMTDPESIVNSITLTLEDYFQVESITDAGIRSQFSQAVAHRARLQEVFHRSSGGMRGEVLKALAAVDEWLTGMGHLAQLLVPYQSEVRRQSETKLHLLERITQLEHRVGEATDPRIKAQLRETIAGRRHQQRAIEELESLVERALLRLERAVAALGTINAQLSMLAARGEQEANAAKLAHDINAEIQEIDAVLLALDRVHSTDLATLDIAPWRIRNDRGPHDRQGGEGNCSCYRRYRLENSHCHRASRSEGNARANQRNARGGHARFAGLGVSARRVAGDDRLCGHRTTWLTCYYLQLITREPTVGQSGS